MAIDPRTGRTQFPDRHYTTKLGGEDVDVTIKTSEMDFVPPLVTREAYILTLRICEAWGIGQCFVPGADRLTGPNGEWLISADGLPDLVYDYENAGGMWVQVESTDIEYRNHGWICDIWILDQDDGSAHPWEATNNELFGHLDPEHENVGWRGRMVAAKWSYEEKLTFGAFADRLELSWAGEWPKTTSMGSAKEEARAKARAAAEAKAKKLNTDG